MAHFNPSSGPSGSRSASGRNQGGHAEIVPSVAPPGFECYYAHERSKVANLFQAFILPLHWSLIRSGLRLRTNDNTRSFSTSSIPLSELTELLPSNWTSRITANVEDGTNQSTNVLVLRYWDPTDSSIHLEAKILEVVKNSVMVVILFRAVNAYRADGTLYAGNKRDVDSQSPGRNSAAGNFILQEYFTALSFTLLGNQGGGIEQKPWFEVYKGLQNFESVVWDQLLEPSGLNVHRKMNNAREFENSTSSRDKGGNQQEQTTQMREPNTPVYTPTPSPTFSFPRPVPYPVGGIGGPLYVPPSVPIGTGGLGRSDLDPLGGIGAGMIGDPRGFRQPAIGPGPLPGAPLPGARFDPFGPPMPNPRPIPGQGGGTGNGFGRPNPDAEQPPPGFEDMFM